MILSVKKQFEKEEQDEVLNLDKQCYEKLEEMIKQQNNRLEDEKAKIIQRTNKETGDVLKKMKKNNELDIENMIQDAELYKQKIDSELKLAENYKQQHISKLEKLKSEVNIQCGKERKQIEKDTEKKINSLSLINQEETEELPENDKTILYNLEKQLISNLNKDILAIKSENAEKIKSEKEKKHQDAKIKSQNTKQEIEMQIKAEIYSNENELKNQLHESISNYKSKKDAELNKFIYEHEQKTTRNIESEKKSQNISNNKLKEENKELLESKIKEHQREITNCEHQLYIRNNELNKLKDEEEKIRAEIRKLETEMQDIKGKEIINESIIIKNLEKEIMLKEHEIFKNEEISKHKVSQLESEIVDFKRNLDRQQINGVEKNEIDKIKESIAVEKEEIKRTQMLLKQDREKWNREMKEYKANPTESKRNELYNIKRIIDKNIKQHNIRVNDVKEAEEMIKFKAFTEEVTEDEELALDMWRCTESKINQTVHIVSQPLKNNNLHIYQRQVNKWCKSRECMKDVMIQHGNWVKNIKEQINRVMSTPQIMKKRIY